MVGAVCRFRASWVFVAIGLLALAPATGRLPDPLTGAVRLAAGTEMFRVPIRYLLVTTVCLAMLAGVGHDWLRRLGRAVGSAVEGGRRGGAEDVRPPAG